MVPIYSVWKDLALKQSKENETRYRIWDYPIKEEYSHVLKAIELNNPVPNASFGFQKVRSIIIQLQLTIKQKLLC